MKNATAKLIAKFDRNLDRAADRRADAAFDRKFIQRRLVWNADRREQRAQGAPDLSLDTLEA